MDIQLKLFDLLKQLERFDFSTPQFLLLLMIFLNIFTYGMDFYHLVKKKSLLETLAIMLCPAIFLITGAMMLGLMVHIPFSGQLNKIVPIFDLSGLWKELLLLCIIFWLCFAAACLMWHKKKTHSETVKWLLTYLLDFFNVIIIMGTSFYYFITGKNPFRQSSIFANRMGIPADLFLFIFLYGIVMLLAKTAVIALSVIVRTYTGKIPFPRYHERKNPTVYLTCYLLFCQNAVVRGAMPALVLYTMILVMLAEETRHNMGNLKQTIIIFIFLCGAMFFLCLLTLSKLLLPLRQLKKWGNPGAMSERFCIEYFEKDAIWSNGDYIVTTHFLIDQRGLLQIYYWENLSRWTREVVSGEYLRIFHFCDGNTCSIPYNQETSEPICSYAKTYYETHRLADTRAQENNFGIKNSGTEPAVPQKLIFCFVAFFMLIYFITMYL